MNLTRMKQFFMRIVSVVPLIYNEGRCTRRGVLFMETKKTELQTEAERRAFLDALFAQIIAENLEALKELAK